MDWRVQIAIVLGVVTIIAILVLKKTFTKGTFKAGKGGIAGSLQGNPNAAPPAEGVDLAGAEFEDENKFTVTDEARVKAPDLKAGSKNTFTFGTSAIEPKKKTEPPKSQSQ